MQAICQFFFRPPEKKGAGGKLRSPERRAGGSGSGDKFWGDEGKGGLMHNFRPSPKQENTG